MYNARKRKSIFQLSDSKHKTPRFNNSMADVPSSLEVLFSMKHIKENIMSHGVSLFKQCQILDRVNKRMQYLVSDLLLNNTKMKIHLDEAHEYLINSNFLRQYRNVSISYSPNSHIVENLEDKLRDIYSLRIIHRQTINTCIRFTEGKWSELANLEVTGEKNGTVLENIPNSVINLKIISSPKDFHENSEATIVNLPSKLESYRVSRIKPNEPNLFPQTLQKLSVLEGCDTAFHEEMILANMQKLHLSHFKFSVLRSNFPVLTHLSIDGCFNQTIDNLPNTLVYLRLIGEFDQSVDNLPPSITHLMFDGYFDQPINKLPPSLTYLYINGAFCQAIDSLPSNLKYLWLSCHMYQEITHLPALKSLTISTACDRIVFPSTLETLVHEDLYHPDNFLLLKDNGSLKRLSMKGDTAYRNMHIPDGVEHLQIALLRKPLFYSFPTSLKMIYTGSFKYEPIISPRDWETKVKIMDKFEHFDDYRDYFYIEFA